MILNVAFIIEFFPSLRYFSEFDQDTSLSTLVPVLTALETPRLTP